MKVNTYARFKINDPYGEWHNGNGIATHNCYIGDRTAFIRKKHNRIDISAFIFNDKSRYIITSKKNVEGMRR